MWPECSRNLAIHPKQSFGFFVAEMNFYLNDTKNQGHETNSKFTIQFTCQIAVTQDNKKH